MRPSDDDREIVAPDASSVEPCHPTKGLTPPAGTVHTRSDRVTHMTPLQERFHEVVRALQSGEVVSYAEVARRSGNRRWARAVGAFLAEFGADVPWWRVVRTGGWLSAPDTADQRRRLQAEGVDVRDGRVVGGVP
ncbi:MAG: methylated-DNA-protein-cysteine methyltransferase related protein [Acidimicrobiaceae bacterium]